MVPCPEAENSAENPRRGLTIFFHPFLTCPSYPPDPSRRIVILSLWSKRGTPARDVIQGFNGLFFPQ